MCFFNGSFNELGVIAMSVFNIYIYIISFTYIHTIYIYIYITYLHAYIDAYSLYIVIFTPLANMAGWKVRMFKRVQTSSCILHGSTYPSILAVVAIRFWEILKLCQHYFLPS